MKRITSSQISGNRGEALIAYLLSKYCLIRHVTSGTDVGVDLYCESITDNQPHNHFWVQVKTTTDKFKSLSSKDINYWRRQPIPVYIFQLRYGDRTNAENYNIRIINLTEEFIKAGPLKTIGQKTYLKVTKDIEIEKFVSENVPKTIARQKMLDGVFLPVRGVEDSYFKSYAPVDNYHKFEKEIFTQIGRAARFLIEDLLNQTGDLMPDKRRHAEGILETFQSNSGKWDFHFYYGRSKFADKNYEEALSAFKRALNKLETDPATKGKSVTLTSYINSLMTECNKKIKMV